MDKDEGSEIERYKQLIQETQNEIDGLLEELRGAEQELYAYIKKLSKLELA